MAASTNAECRELVAKIHDVSPDDLIGWVVLAIIDDGHSAVISNARSAEQVRGVLRSAADNLPDGPDD